jgi:hypothetical protein
MYDAEGRRPLGRCRNRWENNITIDLKDVGCESVIHLVQDREQ